MSVPNTDTFSMQDVVTEIGAGDDLVELFSLATGTFDPAYIGDQTNLLNFRNYSHVPPTDPDADAFIAAAGITDQTQKDAINQLVLDLKAGVIWGKMHAIYPMVGGTALAHSTNLKNPAAFLGIFSGAVVHDANGAKGDGISAKMDTQLVVSNHIPPSVGISLGFYGMGDESVGTGYVIGSGEGTSANDLSQITLIFQRASDGLTRFSAAANFPRQAVWDDRIDGSNSLAVGGGFLQGTAYADGNIRAYHNNSSLDWLPKSSNGYTRQTLTFPIYVLANNGGLNWLTASYSDRGCGFAYIGEEMDAGVMGAYNTAVQAFQTTLGRAV